MARGALAALREHGVDVPTTCNVCGYDDSPLALHHSTALTTVRQDTRIAGAILVERLMQSMHGTSSPPGRNSVVKGTSVSVRVDLRGSRISTTKTKNRKST